MNERYLWAAFLLISIGVILIPIHLFIKKSDYDFPYNNQLKSASIGFILIGIYVLTQDLFLR
jgi:hypothetical protein